MYIFCGPMVGLVAQSHHPWSSGVCLHFLWYDPAAEAQMRRVSAGQLFPLFLDVCLSVLHISIGLLAVLLIRNRTIRGQPQSHHPWSTAIAPSVVSK